MTPEHKDDTVRARSRSGADRTAPGATSPLRGGAGLIAGTRGARPLRARFAPPARPLRAHCAPTARLTKGDGPHGLAAVRPVRALVSVPAQGITISVQPQSPAGATSQR